MGYACPVCGDPQADGSHLANHLAFTAMLGDDGHEEWLDDHAPGWGDMGEAALAEVVVDHAAETAFPQVFEDTAGGLDDDADPPSARSGALFDEGRAGGHGRGRAGEHSPSGGRRHAPESDTERGGDGPSDEEAEAILAEAREMTRRMLEDEPDDDAATGGEHRGAAGDGGRSSGDEGTTPDAAASPEGDAERDNNE